MWVQQADVDRTAVVNRVKRAQGQLAGVLKMLDDDRDPQSVITQLKAVARALDGAAFAEVHAQWRTIAPSEDGGSRDMESLEKLFLSLG